MIANKIRRWSSVMIMAFALLSCGEEAAQKTEVADSAIPEPEKLDRSRQEIHALLDSFNVAAGRADYERYFSFYTNDAVFIGTDATEHWDIDSFKVWSKPYFDKKKTWNFMSLKRNIYFDKTGKVAWFDELLSTQMKICRGSGVLVRENKGWKLSQYVLSMTIPNSQVNPVVKIKTAEEDSIMENLTSGR